MVGGMVQYSTTFTYFQQTIFTFNFIHIQQNFIHIQQITFIFNKLHSYSTKFYSHSTKFYSLQQNYFTFNKSNITNNIKNSFTFNKFYSCSRKFILSANPRNPCPLAKNHMTTCRKENGGRVFISSAINRYIYSNSHKIWL
jgi:hypothetical protein